MMSMRIPPVTRQPPAPPRPARETSDFDDALRDREKVAAPEKEEPHEDAPSAPPAIAAAAPFAFDALIAQLLPELKTAAPKVTQDAADDETMSQGQTSDAALEMPGEAEVEWPPVAQRPVKSTALREQGFDDGAKDRPAGAVTPQDEARTQGARARHDDAHDPAPTRAVAVKNVSTAQHFPVVADPVRQIASEVTRAIEAPSATSAAAPDPAASSVKTLNVLLEPESLGTVTLRMRLSGNQLSVRVDVAEPATLDMIQRERDRLQKSMTSESVSIDRLEIRAAHDPAPVTSGDNANAPRQDASPQGQASRQNENGPRSGEQQRREARGESQTGRDGRHGQDQDSTRRAESRGVYL